MAVSGSLRTAFVLAALMFAASGAAIVARPNAKLAQELTPIDLALMIPKQFGQWRESPQRIQVVDPQTQETLDRIYTQLLTRVYVNSEGYSVMLSIAYGDEQRGRLNVHRPENCYPAQGFAVNKIEPGELRTPYGEIPVRRLATSNGARWEPLTYWIAVGGKVPENRLDRRLLDLSLGLAGRIPDGMVFRVSSIDRDEQNAYLRQAEFVNQLLGALPADDRKRISGLSGGPPA